MTAGTPRTDALFITRYAETIAKTKTPSRAAWNGNTGIPPPPLVELVLEAEVVALEEVETVVVLDVDVIWELEVLEVLEVVDVTAVGVYWNVASALTCGG